MLMEFFQGFSATKNKEGEIMEGGFQDTEAENLAATREKDLVRICCISIR